MTTFPPDVVDAVLAHMNDDHADDSLAIVQAFAEPGASTAAMTYLDSEGATWEAGVGGAIKSITIPWPGPVVERADIRREVVNLYEAAAARLGLPAREEH